MRRITASALVALVALVSMLAVAGSAMAQSVPDTLVSGTITGATSGTVTVTSGGTLCTNIAPTGGATVSATGTYQIVVNCAAGAGQVLLNGVAVTGATFTLTPGVPATANGTIGAAPTATATATSAGTPIGPKTGNTAPASSSSNAWMLMIVGLGALALGVGGVAAVRKS